MCDSPVAINTLELGIILLSGLVSVLRIRLVVRVFVMAVDTVRNGPMAIRYAIHLSSMILVLVSLSTDCCNQLYQLHQSFSLQSFVSSRFMCLLEAELPGRSCIRRRSFLAT